MRWCGWCVVAKSSTYGHVTLEGTCPIGLCRVAMSTEHTQLVTWLRTLGATGRVHWDRVDVNRLIVWSVKS